jgi:predicted transcriptional regulator
MEDGVLNLPVSEIMNDHPIRVRSDVSIRNVAHLLLRYRINGILVVNPDDPGQVLGVFTTSDLLAIIHEVLTIGAHKIGALNAVADHPVSEFLADEFIKLQKSDSAAKAIGLLHKTEALTIPIYDGDKLVGVLGRHDLINIAFA